VRPAPDFPNGGWVAPMLAEGWFGPLGTCSADVARREIADRVFDLPHWPSSADRAFSERCCVVGLAQSLDEILGGYTIHPASQSAAARALDNAASVEWRYRFFRNVAIDRASFIPRTHGVEVDEGALEAAVAGHMWLRVWAFRGDAASWKDIRPLAGGRLRALGWAALFALPRAWRSRVLTSWTRAHMRMRRGRRRRRGLVV
jgi:hypothetical protein